MEGDWDMHLHYLELEEERQRAETFFDWDNVDEDTLKKIDRMYEDAIGEFIYEVAGLIGIEKSDPRYECFKDTVLDIVI